MCSPVAGRPERQGAGTGADAHTGTSEKCSFPLSHICMRGTLQKWVRTKNAPRPTPASTDLALSRAQTGVIFRRARALYPTAFHCVDFDFGANTVSYVDFDFDVSAGGSGRGDSMSARGPNSRFPGRSRVPRPTGHSRRGRKAGFAGMWARGCPLLRGGPFCHQPLPGHRTRKTARIASDKGLRVKLQPSCASHHAA